MKKDNFRSIYAVKRCDRICGMDDCEIAGVFVLIKDHGKFTMFLMCWLPIRRVLYWVPAPGFRSTGTEFAPAIPFPIGCKKRSMFCVHTPLFDGSPPIRKPAARELDGGKGQTRSICFSGGNNYLQIFFFFPHI